jgi:hypothetical protein
VSRRTPPPRSSAVSPASHARSEQGPDRPRLLCLAQSFWPATTPTAIRAGKLLERLAASWEVTVLSENGRPRDDSPLHVEAVRGRRPRRLFAALRRARLAKLLELLVWPDDSIFWVLPAVLRGRRVIRRDRPSAIVVFMMPYSSGLAGVILSRITGLPLVLNLDDSPTCTDMHPHFPTRLHYRLARALEDLYVRRADAVVYVSQTNLERVGARQPQDAGGKLHLVRYGAERVDRPPARADGEDFEIVYVGAMSGWWSLIEQSGPPRPLQRAYEAWTRLGRYELTVLDQRSSSPAAIGLAILDAIGRHPDWAGRVRFTAVGNPYPEELVARALEDAGVAEIVTVRGPVPHEQVTDLLARADLLFLALPGRPDGTAGGRISAKTYEYLATDRPILAAVPAGENWDYLIDKPGVWLSEPSDERRMASVIAELAGAKFAGMARTFDRSGLRAELSYEARAAEFSSVIRAAIEHRRGGGRQPPPPAA